jgi:hypothetical protein
MVLLIRVVGSTALQAIMRSNLFILFTLACTNLNASVMVTFSDCLWILPDNMVLKTAQSNKDSFMYSGFRNGKSLMVNFITNDVEEIHRERVSYDELNGIYIYRYITAGESLGHYAYAFEKSGGRERVVTINLMPNMDVSYECDPQKMSNQMWHSSKE